MMAMLFAVRILEERTKFDQVPRLLKQDVADILVNDFGMPELVPGEFGGSAEHPGAGDKDGSGAKCPAGESDPPAGILQSRTA